MQFKKKLEQKQIKRFESIDALKALGISLVVLGHTLGISRQFDHWVFSFHMPLFFFISGFLRRPDQFLHFKEAIIHYAKRLLLPYAVFGLITYLPWVFFTRKYGLDSNLQISIYKPILGLFYGIGVDGWLQHNPMLWFMPTLFVLHIIFELIFCESKKNTSFIKIVGCVCFGWLLTFTNVRMPWGFEIALIALPFYYFGYLFKKNIKYLTPKSISLRIILCITFLCLHYLFQLSNARVDMNAVSFGVPWLFYIGSFLGIIWMYLLSILLPPFALFRKIAQSSIVIYLLHRLFFSIISATGMIFFGEINIFKSTMTGSLVYLVLAMIMGALLFPLIKRTCPIVIGYK